MSEIIKTENLQYAYPVEEGQLAVPVLKGLWGALKDVAPTAITAGAAALYALFYPVLVGIQIPSWYGTCLLRWLPSWPF